MASEVFAVLAEPARRRVLDLLLEAPRPAGELAGLLGLSQPGTSKHLRVLREAGLVRVRRDGQRRWYEVRADPLLEIDAWLRPYRRFWAGRLDALENLLDNRSNYPDSDYPDTKNPDTKNPDTKNPDTKNPDTKNPDTKNPDSEYLDSRANRLDTDNPDTENPDTRED